MTEMFELSGGEHAVLMLHGLSGSHLEMKRVGELLNKAGFSVFIPDIPGYCYGGDSTTWQEWMAIARNHLHTLQPRFTTVSLLGLSMGATMSLLLAAEEKITGALVMLAPSLGYDGWAIPWYRFLLDWVKYLPFRKYYRYEESEPYGLKNEKMRERIKHAFIDREVSEIGGASISLEHIIQGDLLTAEARRKTHKVTCPALIIHAIDDESVHPRHADWAYRNIASSDKEILFLGDSYHMITLDNERQMVFNESEEFLKRVINSKFETPVFEIPDRMTRGFQRYAKQRL